MKTRKYWSRYYLKQVIVFLYIIFVSSISFILFCVFVWGGGGGGGGGAGRGVKWGCGGDVVKF